MENQLSDDQSRGQRCSLLDCLFGSCLRERRGTKPLKPSLSDHQITETSQMHAKNWIIQRSQRPKNPNPKYALLFMRCKRRIRENGAANPAQ
jgi:hypothetical protein